MATKKTSLKLCIEELSAKNTDSKFPDQAINQTESLKSLSSDLYTDNIRLIYELIQNVDDAQAKNIILTILANRYFIIAHDGKAFDEKDLQGLCGVNNGTKTKDLDKTGYKGLGFKAVFGKSDDVMVYSDREYFRFDSSYQIQWNQQWGTSDQQTWERENDRQFIYPCQVKSTTITKCRHLFTKISKDHHKVLEFSAILIELSKLTKTNDFQTISNKKLDEFKIACNSLSTSLSKSKDIKEIERILTNLKYKFPQDCSIEEKNEIQLLTNQFPRNVQIIIDYLKKTIENINSQEKDNRIFDQQKMFSRISKKLFSQLENIDDDIRIVITNRLSTSIFHEQFNFCLLMHRMKQRKVSSRFSPI